MCLVCCDPAGLGLTAAPAIEARTLSKMNLRAWQESRSHLPNRDKEEAAGSRVNRGRASRHQIMWRRHLLLLVLLLRLAGVAVAAAGTAMGRDLRPLGHRSQQDRSRQEEVLVGGARGWGRGQQGAWQRPTARGSREQEGQEQGACQLAAAEAAVVGWEGGVEAR